MTKEVACRTIPPGAEISIEDEGNPVIGPVSTLTVNFVGAGVVATTPGAGEATVTISGAPVGAAGGDLSGSYPNPSVVDDSHNHTSATLPATIVYDGDAAGGDLSGTYPNPTLVATGVGAGGPTGSSSIVPVITYDAKGRLTAVSTATITASAIGAVPTTRNLTAGAGLIGGGDLSADRTFNVQNSDGTITVTADDVSRAAITGDIGVPAGSNASTLASIVAPATVGDATHIPVITYDAKGRITSTTTAAISSGATTPTSMQANLTVASFTQMLFRQRIILGSFSAILGTDTSLIGV